MESKGKTITTLSIRFVVKYSIGLAIQVLPVVRSFADEKIGSIVVEMGNCIESAMFALFFCSMGFQCLGALEHYRRESLFQIN